MTSMINASKSMINAKNTMMNASFKAYFDGKSMINALFSFYFSLDNWLITRWMTSIYENMINDFHFFFFGRSCDCICFHSKNCNSIIFFVNTDKKNYNSSSMIELLILLVVRYRYKLIIL